MEKREGEETEDGTTQEKGSICGFDSLYHLLQTSLSPQLFQEVNRILLGLNCGKKLESIALSQPVKALSANHDFDLQGILRDLSKVSTTGAQEHSVKSSEQNNGEADGSDVMAAAGIITSADENMVLPSER